MCCSNNGTSDNGVESNRKDSMKYDYATTVIQPKQPVASYETMSLHEEDVSESAASKTNLDKPSAPVYSEVSNPHSNLQLEHDPTASPVYSEVHNLHSNPQLEHNSAYDEQSEETDHQS